MRLADVVQLGLAQAQLGLDASLAVAADCNVFSRALELAARARPGEFVGAAGFDGARQLGLRRAQRHFEFGRVRHRRLQRAEAAFERLSRRVPCRAIGAMHVERAGQLVRVAASAFSMPVVSACELCCAASWASSVWRVACQARLILEMGFLRAREFGLHRLQRLRRLGFVACSDCSSSVFVDASL